MGVSVGVGSGVCVCVCMTFKFFSIDPVLAKAFRSVLPPMSQIREFYDFSVRVKGCLPNTFAVLCSEDARVSLVRHPYHVRQLAALFDFALHFDHLKMRNAHLQVCSLARIASLLIPLILSLLFSLSFSFFLSFYFDVATEHLSPNHVCCQSAHFFSSLPPTTEHIRLLSSKRQQNEEAGHGDGDGRETSSNKGRASG